MGGIAALLLAAGESSRMGELKALLPWQGRTLLEHQLQVLLDSGASQVIVVLGHQADRLEPLIKNTPGVKCVLNRDYRQGKTTSIKAGLKALETPVDSILILAVDQPRSAATVRIILEKHQKSRAAFTVPTYKGKGGHPTVFSGELLPELEDISEATQGLKTVVRRHARDVQRVELDTEEVLLDLNTPEEYQKALERQGLTSM